MSKNIIQEVTKIKKLMGLITEDQFSLFDKTYEFKYRDVAKKKDTTKYTTYKGFEKFDPPSYTEQIKLVGPNGEEEIVDIGRTYASHLRDNEVLVNPINYIRTSNPFNSGLIKRAIKKAFPYNWEEADESVSGTTAGLRGIYTIGDKLKGTPYESEDWSILNYFDTKRERHEELNKLYINSKSDKTPFDWLVDFLIEKSKDLDNMVNKQWNSIKRGDELERKALEYLIKYHKGKDIKTYSRGSKMDRNKGVDITIDGVNYQIKPINSIYRNDKSEYIVSTYGMKDYTKPSLVNKIAYYNIKTNEVYIFDNSEYLVKSGGGQVLHKKEPEHIYPEPSHTDIDF
jgi:hypothetical protein